VHHGVRVATSNGILMITFANSSVARVRHEARAAARPGRTRLRPVADDGVGDALGMLPMSLGLGEGGEQNAPSAGQ
jgi:multidrug efflux pump subunit AcrB